MSDNRIYPPTERDSWLCDCGRTYAEASQEEPGDTSCVYCGSDNWTPAPQAKSGEGGVALSATMESKNAG